MTLPLAIAAETSALEEGSVRLGVSLDALMDRAGLAVAEQVRRLRLGQPGKVLVLVGPGNNGGDGLVCAAHLRHWGWNVTLHLVPQREREASRFPVLRELKSEAIPGEPVDVVVDALLGTGNSRPLGGAILDAINIVRQRQPSAQVVAVDVPSGVNADTGAADDATLPAAVTVTLGVAKAGLFQFPAQQLAGRIEVADIGIPPSLLMPVRSWLSDSNLVRPFLPKRPRDGHKGTFGKLLVVAGAAAYPGAPYLTSAAAARAGAGLLRVALPASVHPIVATKLTEATFARLPETPHGSLARQALPLLEHLLAEDFDCLLIGPGLSQDPEAAEVICALLLEGRKLPAAVVIDADGLNSISKQLGWQAKLPPSCVLTPHPAELSRLSGLPLKEVLANRYELARKLAIEWGQVIVAKGANTIVAAPDGRVVIDPGANPLVGTAGTGDVLAGTIAGFLTQGCPPWEGAVAATRVCSLAVSQLSGRYGLAGMLAGDLPEQIPSAMRAMSVPEV